MSFAVGDKVLLSTRNLNLTGSRKFKDKFVGPFVVQQRIGEVACRLDLSSRDALHNVHPVQCSPRDSRTLIPPMLSRSRGNGRDLPKVTIPRDFSGTHGIQNYVLNRSAHRLATKNRVHWCNLLIDSHFMCKIPRNPAKCSMILA